MRRNTQLSPVSVSYLIVTVILLTFVIVAQNCRSVEHHVGLDGSQATTLGSGCSQQQPLRLEGIRRTFREAVVASTLMHGYCRQSLKVLL